MIVGVLKEIKNNENRVAMTPAGVEMLKKGGHTVLVEKAAGVGSGFSDDMYKASGADIIGTPAEIYKRADMVMHVKEPLKQEFGMIRKGQIIFTYLHLAADKELTDALIQSEAVCIAYETIMKNGTLPLLTPMSEIAGRMAAQEAAKYLEAPQGGLGKLMSGVSGVEPATVVVLGGGMVGTGAAKMACGLGAKVYILDINLDRLRYLDDIMPANCITRYSSPSAVKELLAVADAVIGAVLVPGAKAPKLITKDMLPIMQKGAVMVDVAIDQGGCFETSHPTTHADPVFKVNDVVHYCVANMPGAVPQTATAALTNATMPYAVALANKGWKQAMKDDPSLALGLNLYEGQVTCKAVAEAFGYNYVELKF